MARTTKTDAVNIQSRRSVASPVAFRRLDTMLLLRSVLLVVLGLALASCQGVPLRAGLALNASATIRVEAPPPPPPAPAVALDGAAGVEFFGVPLEEAQDVIFVLDVSGSMSANAQAGLAVLAAPKEDAPPEPPPAPEPDKEGADSAAADGTASAQVVVTPGAGASAVAYDPNGNPVPQDPPVAYDQYGNPVRQDPPVAYDQYGNPIPPPPATDPQGNPVAANGAPAPSGPLQATKLQVAQAELIDALDRLPEGTRMNVIFFADGVEAFAPRLVPLMNAEREQLIAYVESTSARGSTALVPAMRLAMMLQARRIVLLSDGQGNVGGIDAELLRDAREAIRGGVRIDTIGLGSGHDRQLLGTLATESGGLYQSF